MGTSARVEVLGRLRAVGDGWVVDRFRTRQTGALLGLLALQPGRALAREVLIDALWPGCPADAGRNSLSTALWSLRRELRSTEETGQGLILANRGTVALNADCVTTDLAQFDARLDAAARAADPLPDLMAAVDLYRGSPLADYCDGWVLAEQTRANERFAAALELLVKHLEAAGDLVRAIDYACRGLAVDPLRESSYQLLMRLHLAAGQPSLAQRRFRELERVLAAELACEPSAESRALVGRLHGAEQVQAATEPCRAVAVPTGTVTLLLAEGAEVVSEPVVRRYRGVLLPATAPLAAAFRSAEDALVCALVARLEGGEAVGDGRIAVDTGVVEAPDGLVDTAFWDRATRLLAAAWPGQTLCSERAAALGLDDHDPRLRLDDLGLYRLGPSLRAEHLFQVTGVGLPRRDFPPPVALVGQATRLPRPLSRFFGRETELAELVSRCTTGTARVVAIVGPGGSGKTRLALEAGHRLARSFGGAVWYLPLAELVTPHLLTAALLRVLQLRDQAGEPALAQAAAALGRQPGLLILDNVEHLLPTAATWLADLLAQVSDLRCLVTSRCRLELPGEQDLFLRPLPTPGETAATDLAAVPSVALLVDRAQAVVPDFRLSETNAAEVAALCRAVEGVPLALELAAGRLASLSPRQVLERLGDRFEVLATDDAQWPERHRSLRRVLADSFELLPPRLREFCCRLAVFRGGWSLTGAEQVCDEPSAADDLARLRDAALITSCHDRGGVRFTMLEALREFAWGVLDDAQRRRLRAAHGRHYHQLAAAAAAGMDRPGEEEWFARVEEELANLRAAITWALEEQPLLAADLATALGHFYDVRGHWREGLRAAQDAAEGLPASEVTRRLACSRQVAWLSHKLGDNAAAVAGFEACRALAEAMGDRARVRNAWYSLGGIAQATGRLTDAEHCYRQCLAITGEDHPSHSLAQACGGLANVALQRADLATAHHYADRALAVWRAVGGERSVAQALLMLARVAEWEGDTGLARAHYDEAFARLDVVGDRPALATRGLIYGRLDVQDGRLDDARRGAEQSLAALRAIGDAAGVAEALVVLGDVAARQAQPIEARRYLEEALRLATAALQVGVETRALETLARLDAASGQPALAVRRLASAARRRHDRHLVEPATAPDLASLREVLAASLGEPAYLAAWSAGWSAADAGRPAGT